MSNENIPFDAGDPLKEIYGDLSIDDYRIYDRLLPSVEIETIHATQGHDGIVDGLVLRAPMTEQAPTVGAVADSPFC